MISFEMEDMPNGQNVTNDQFAAIHEIVSKDWSRNYVVTDAKETDGDWFLILEKREDGDPRETETYYRIEFDGDWGVLWEKEQPETDEEFDARSASYTDAEFEQQFGRPRDEYDPPQRNEAPHPGG